MYQPGKLAEFLPSQPLSYPPEPDATGRILLEAAQLIRERGHAKNIQRDQVGRMCVHGAINAAMAHDRSYFFMADGRSLAEKRIYDFLNADGAKGLQAGAGFYSSADWNNAPSRTATEVIAALEDAAFHGVA